MSLQYAALERYGCDVIRGEHASGGSMDRSLWNALLIPRVMRKGDTLVVWKLDRLGRSLSGLLAAVEELEKRGVNLVSITEQIDTTSATGRFFFHIMAAMAEWERSIISERTKAGLAMRKAQGLQMGRPGMIDGNEKRLRAARRLHEQGKLFDADGERLMTDGQLMIELNKADKDADPITSTQTVARWRKNGYRGLKEQGDG